MHDRLPLPQPDLDREEKATRRERKFLASLDRSSTGRAQPIDRTSTTGRSVPQPVEPVEPLWPRKPIFLIHFFFNT